MFNLIANLFRPAEDAAPARPQPAARTRLGLTALEAREVPAATAVLSNGVLTVTGTAASETVRVRQVADTATHGAISVDGAKIRFNGQSLSTVPDYLVSKVIERGGGGDDKMCISLTASTPAHKTNGNIAVVLDGGAGANKYGLSRFDGVNSFRMVGDAVIIDPVLTLGQAMPNAVLDKWAALGGVAGPLGKPAADVAAAGGGQVVRFQHGDIYYTAGTGAVAVYGAIKAKYDALGGAGSYFGLPTADMQSGRG